MSLEFLDKRFHIVAGKGGVGKSTLCAVMGLLAAKAGKRTVIAEFNTRGSQPRLFGKASNGYEVTPLCENLFSINIQPRPAMREYGLRKLKLARVYDVVFENDAMKRMLRMIPGMTELILLGKAFDLERERAPGGQPAWDLVIIDAPATGHGVSLLKLPQTILNVVSVGPMADEVRDMKRLLEDDTRTRLSLVTLPEEMPVRETFELMHVLDHELRIPQGELIINGVWPQVLAPDEVERFQGVCASLSEDESGLLQSLKYVEEQARRRAFQQPYIEMLNQASWSRVHTLPFLFRAQFGPAELQELGAFLSDPSLPRP